MNYDKNEKLKAEWTDQFVEADTERPELKRFAGRVGRVTTVNWNDRCLVDFADGAWYDIAPQYLKKVADQEGAKAKFDFSMNSNQASPVRQG